MLILLHTPAVSFEGIGIAAILILKQYVHVLNLLRQIQFIDIEEDASTWHPSYFSKRMENHIINVSDQTLRRERGENRKEQEGKRKKEA